MPLKGNSSLPPPKRKLSIRYVDGSSKDLELTTAICIKVKKPMLCFEETPKGWKITWSEGLIEDFTKISSFHIVREG